jgi:L-fuculose-phosphate aldolase
MDLKNRILNTKLMHPSEQLAIAIRRIYERGLTTTSGGNLSLMDDNGDMWITPSAIDKGSLTPKDIICVKKDGTIVGPHKPSSEFPFHKAIYEMRSDIRAIIHAHPPALVAFSIVRKVPDTSVLAHAHHVCGPIGYASYELPGSNALGAIISKEFAKGYKAIIMENHGTVLGGSDMHDAYCRFESLEFCSLTSLSASVLGTPKTLSKEALDAYAKETNHLMPETNHSGYSPEERLIRSEICSIVHRACQQGLMMSSSGTVSMRTKGNDFIITPSDVSRWDLLPDALVQIKDGKREQGKVPCRAVDIHQEIYKKHPHVNSVISSQSPYLMAFAVANAPFDVRTIPESWIFLQDVSVIPFAEKNTVPGLLSQNRPAVIVQNDSFIVTGDKLLQTFDKLEVAEFSAKSIVMSTSLGKMVPINQPQVDDLRRVFLKN